MIIYNIVSFWNSLIFYSKLDINWSHIAFFYLDILLNIGYITAYCLLPLHSLRSAHLSFHFINKLIPSNMYVNVHITYVQDFTFLPNTNVIM